ncbi:MAG: response regulator [Desulfamplus sp.]|nr:response regulator [Desulfamplus sp.]
MKKTIQTIILLSILCLPVHLFASDYLVDFISENYKESNAEKSDTPKIYHTIQVETEELGTRVLVLKGDDIDYRIWLRQYLATAKKLIVTVPEKENPQFRISKLFSIDVKMVHPIAENQWKEPEPEIIVEIEVKPPFKGKKHIMVVDDNQKRRDLIQMLVKKLGFPVTIASNSYDALNIFKNQPDKFSLVIADGNTYKGVSTTSLVKNILETSPDVSVILGTDYKEEKTTAMLTDFFAGFSRVVIKPLVLSELSKTILQVLDKKV